MDQGFLYTDGVFTIIADPGGTRGTNVLGINDAGQIVGVFNNGSVDQGFLYLGGSFTTIDVPGATSTNATGINNAGQIVGVFDNGSGPDQRFLDTGGVFTTIDVPGATSTWATGINSAGQIVGVFGNGSWEHGFLDTGGVFTTIDFPGATGTSGLDTPFGINDTGQIVGNFTVGGVVHGFVATPVPAPTADMLMRNSNTGAFEVYDINNNAITSYASIGQVGLEWTVAGFGDFSGNPGESDMLLRATSGANAGRFEVYDISNNMVTSAALLGAVGPEWTVAGLGDFSGNANETDMLMRNSNTGGPRRRNARPGVRTTL